MAPPPVTIYTTSLTSAPKVREHIALLRRALNGWEIPYQEYDLVNEPEAKQRWQRSKPAGKVIGLPGYLVGGEWVGTMDDFEEAVETQTLPAFLKQDIDLKSTSSTTGASETQPTVTVGEAELERLMREMSESDLDALAGELGVETPKVGLMVPEGVEPITTTEEVQSTLADTKEGVAGLESVGVKGTAETVTDKDLAGALDKVQIGGGGGGGGEDAVAEDKSAVSTKQKEKID